MGKVVVANALQLIGFHLCQRFLHDGVQVVGVDTVTASDKVKEEMLLSFGRNANFEFVNRPLQTLDLEQYLHDTTMFFYPPVQGNTQSELIKVAEACATKHVRLIYLSSLDVYGEGDGVFTETSPLHPVTDLGKQRKAEERLLLQMLERYVVFRTPLTYGPWQDSRDCIQQSLYAQIKENKDEQDSSLLNCEQEKKYMFIDDLIEAIFAVLASGFQQGTLNISNDEEKYSYQKMWELTHFKPHVSFEEGLKRQKSFLLKLLKRNPNIYNEEEKTDSK